MKNKKIQKTIIVIMLCLCTFMGMMLTSARSVILKTLLTELDGIQYYSITVMITSMMMAAVNPVAGKLSDIIGRKMISLSGIAGYGMAALICGLAPNAYVFIGGIVLIGISYGLMTSVTGAIIAENFMDAERPRINSYVQVASSAAQLAGPVLGGFILDTLTWRVVYAAIIPIAVIAFALSAISLESRKWEKGVAFQFDIAGTIALLFCVIALLFALAAGGNVFPWTSPMIIGCLLASIASGAILFFVEKNTDVPIIPYRLLRRKPYLMCLALTFLAWYSFAVMNFVTVFYQDIIGVSATVSGTLVVPRQLAQIITALAAGILLGKTGSYKKLGVGFFVIYGIGMLLMSLFTSGTAFIFIVAAEMCFGIGISGQGVITNSYVQEILDPEEMGIGYAFYSFLGSLASSAGAAIGGCVMNQIPDQAAGLKANFISYFIVIATAIVIALAGKWKVVPKKKPGKHWLPMGQERNGI